MLALHDLVEMQRKLSDASVLSVYIAAEEHDPTERSSWRMRLTAQLDRQEQELEGDVRDAFRAARRLLENELQPYRGFLPGRGWVAFVTPERVWHCEEVPAPMPDLVRWREGILIGPYLRALKQSRPVMLVLIDRRRARLLRYESGALTELVDHRADEFIDDLTDRNMSKRAAAHSGVRGETATDAAERILRLESERLLRFVVGELNIAGDVLVVLGGPTRSVAALEKQLEPEAGDRLQVEPALHLTMSAAEIQPLLESAVSRLTQRLQQSAVRQVMDAAGAGGLGTLGIEATAAAAVLGQIDRLLLTTRFVAEDEERAERLIAQALDHAATVELMTDEAGALLEESGGGVGAVLRFATPRVLAASDTGAREG
ncbi:MAG TPA: hypothetical protein VFZ24_16280 [Longimicrobiales bacterium]